MFPIQVDYHISMYVVIAICIITVIVMEEQCRPDGREKGFWKKVVMTVVAAFIACIAHGLLFSFADVVGLVKCPNYHPSDYAHVQQLSDSEREKFYANNGLTKLGNKAKY